MKQQVPESTTDNPKNKPNDTYVQSLARGLSVICSFSAEHPRQTLSQVAQATGLTRAGARRLLLTLESLGYVSYEGRYFFLTPKILELGFSYLNSTPFYAHAQPILEQLTQLSGESSSIAVLDDTEIVYVLRIPKQRIMSINLSIGSRLPACYTVMGRILLSGLSDQELDEVIARSVLKSYTPYSITDPQLLKNNIIQIREQGWAVLDQELEIGLFSIGAAITNRQGKIIASVNISGNAGKTSMDTFKANYLPLLLDKAREISSYIVDVPVY